MVATVITKDTHVTLPEIGCKADDPTFDNGAVINGYAADFYARKKYASRMLLVTDGQWFKSTQVNLPSGFAIDGPYGQCIPSGEQDFAILANKRRYGYFTHTGGGDSFHLRGAGCRVMGFGHWGRRISGAWNGVGSGSGTRCSAAIVVEGEEGVDTASYGYQVPTGKHDLGRNMTFVENAIDISFTGTQHADETTIDSCLSAGFDQHIKVNNNQAVSIKLTGIQNLGGYSGSIAYYVVAGGPLLGADCQTVLNYYDATLLKLGNGYSQNTNEFRLRFRWDTPPSEKNLTLVDLSEASYDVAFAYPYAVYIQGLICGFANSQYDPTKIVLHRGTTGADRNDQNVHLQVQNLDATNAATYAW